MSVKYRFRAGCCCESKFHDIILEFPSVENFEEYRNDKMLSTLLMTTVKLYFSTIATTDECQFNNNVEISDIECDKYHFSFDKHKEYNEDDVEEDENKFSFLSPMATTQVNDNQYTEELKILQAICTYRIYDKLERDLIVQFKNVELFDKYASNNFNDILPNLNKFFWEEYDIKHTPDIELFSEKINASEVPHIIITQ